MEKHNNEDLQSRRDFFKKAAKKALPILGAIVLANAPVIANAAEETPMGCKYGCTAVCSTSACQGTCQGGCRFTCTNTCKNYGCKGVNKA
ncbi:MAG: Cys-Xaa-Xaa-Xaa repeat radical SAM target protein [Muribaculaceae bacterium]